MYVGEYMMVDILLDTELRNTASYIYNDLSNEELETEVEPQK